MTDKPSNNPFKKDRPLRPNEQAHPLLWWLAGGRGDPPTGDDILDHNDYRAEKKAAGEHFIGLKDFRGGDIHFSYKTRSKEEKKREKEKRQGKGDGGVRAGSSGSGGSGKK
ncbi:hypothetical protein MBLNU457_5894t1 [Dothideomycetes sp. NU457]